MYNVKQELQNLLFPDGIEYDLKNDRVQTSKVNSGMKLISCLSNDLSKIKSGQKKKFIPLSAPVTQEGLTYVDPYKTPL